MNYLDHIQQPQTEAGVIDFIRFIKRHSDSIIRIGVAITLFAVLLRLVISIVIATQAPRGRDYAVITIGDVNGPITENKQRLELIKIPSVQYALLKQLQNKNAGFKTYDQFPQDAFGISEAGGAIVVAGLMDNGQLNRTLLEVVSSYLTEEHPKLYAQKTAYLDDQIKTESAKVGFIDTKVRTYEQSLARINRIINGLSPANSANSQALQGFLQSRDEIQSKLDDWEKRKLDQSNYALTQLKQARSDARPTNVEISPRVQSTAQIDYLSLVTTALFALPLGLLLATLWLLTKHWLEKNNLAV